MQFSFENLIDLFDFKIWYSVINFVSLMSSCQKRGQKKLIMRSGALLLLLCCACFAFLYSKDGMDYENEADWESAGIEFFDVMRQKGAWISEKIKFSYSAENGLDIVISGDDIAQDESLMVLPVSSTLQLENVYYAFPSWKLLDKSQLAGNDYNLVIKFKKRF